MMHLNWKFKTESEELSYFYQVLATQIRCIVNNHKKESDVIVIIIQRLLNDCLNCSYCLAGINSATLTCMSSGDLLEPNQTDCNKKDRTIELGCYTHNN